MRSSRSRLLVPCAVAVAALVGGCAYSQGDAAVGGGSTVRVGLQQIPPDYVWQAKDWGAPYHLRSTNSVSPAAAREIQQLMSGQVDVVDSGSGPALSAIGRAPSKLLIVGIRQSGGQRDELMVPASSKAHSIADLKGQKIAVPAGSGAAIAFSLYLKSQGLSTSDFVTVNMEPAAEIQALKQGLIAAGVAWEPTPSFGVTSGAVRSIANFGQQTTDPNFLLTTRAFASSHKQALINFLAATVAMDKVITQQRSQAAAMAAGVASQAGATASPAALERAFSLTDTNPAVTSRDISDLSPVQQAMINSGHLAGKVDAAAVVDGSYLQQAQALVH